jgi:hypothetical protein
MQIFEVWNDFFTKILRIFSCFLVFFYFNFQKVQKFNSNPKSSKIKNMNNIPEISKKIKMWIFENLPMQICFVNYQKISNKIKIWYLHKKEIIFMTLGERRKKEQGQFSIFQWWMAYSGKKIVIWWHLRE